MIFLHLCQVFDEVNVARIVDKTILDETLALALYLPDQPIFLSKEMKTSPMGLRLNPFIK